jgi:aminoglycoside 6'-N-acetyltransferase
MNSAPGAVEEKYGPRVDGNDPTHMWVVEIDRAPAGLLQSYRHRDYPDHDASVGIDDAVGIDYFLAAGHAGRGLGSVVIGQFVALVGEQYPDARWCVATPAQDNEPSWRCLDRAGFERRGPCQPPDEPPAFTYAVGLRQPV